MNAVDIIALGIIIILLVFAVRYMIVSSKKGCCHDCSHCSGCDKRK